MTRHQWTPDRVVSADLAAAVIAEQFPGLAGLPVRPFGAGWDNVLYAVGDYWLFRFVHRAVALEGARRELAVLTRIADALPLAVPHPVMLGRPTAEVAWPFWGARCIPGTELAEVGLSDDARAPVARAMGGFLHALHTLGRAAAVAEAAGRAGAALPVDPLRRADPTNTVPRARERLERLADDGVDVRSDALSDLLGTAEGVGAPVGEPILVHGDLHVRHVLVSAAGEATGVVDWGDTALADPAVDLMLCYAAFTGKARQAFLDAYGDVPADRELRARSLAVHVSAALLEYARAEGRAALIEEATASLRRVVE